MDTSNRNFEKKLLSNWTLPVVVPAMNPITDQKIALIVVAPQTLLMPATKEVVADVASGGAWFNRTLRQVSRMGVDRSTPGRIRNSVSVEHAYSLVMIVTVVTHPTCGITGSRQVINERQSISPGWSGQTQKLDAAVDGKLPDDLNSASIFSKVISHKLSNGFSRDLYLRFRMKLMFSKPSRHNSWIWGSWTLTH